MLQFLTFAGTAIVASVVVTALLGSVIALAQRLGRKRATQPRSYPAGARAKPV